MNKKCLILKKIHKKNYMSKNRYHYYTNCV